jgi:SsrA-binding protein
MRTEPVEKTIIARNPRARHDFHLLDTWEAGLVLTGPEVKSLRDKKASLGEAYAHVRNGEVWLEGMTIARYEAGSYNNPPPARSRKLLLHKREIERRDCAKGAHADPAGAVLQGRPRQDPDRTGTRQETARQAR